MRKITRILSGFIFFAILILSTTVEATEVSDSVSSVYGADYKFTAASADTENPQYIDWPTAPAIEGEAFILVENNSSSILAGSNYDEKMYPASTTKILTCLVALENCSLDEIVTFSENAVDLEEGDSNIGMVAGEQITVKDCLYGLMIASGNECGNAIAEHVAGSVEAFAELMNKKAAEVGAFNSHFTNPHGLFDEDHYTTAYDLFLIAQAAYENSTFVDIISHSSYTIGPTNKDPNEKVLTTTVSMINSTSDAYNPAVIGGKTGYLSEAGRCLVVFAEQDNLTLISVVLKSGYDDVFDDTQALLDYAFNNFTIKNISEEEKRFSYSDAATLIYLDASASILTLNNLSFEALDSAITFAEDMDEDTYEDTAEAAGIADSKTKILFATINYSYMDHYLGQVYVFRNAELTFTGASFVQVRYISYWYLIAAVIAVILLMIITGKLAHIHRAEYVRARREAVRRWRDRD